MSINDNVNSPTDTHQDSPAAEIAIADSERPNGNLHSLAQALELDNHADYTVYINDAIEKQDRKALSKEMLSFIVKNRDGGNARAMRRLLMTEGLPWSKVHGKYLCKDRDVLQFKYCGTSIFTCKHISYPSRYFRNLIEKQLIIPRCQKYHCAKHDRLLEMLDKFSPDINKIADYLLYHSESMYSTYTVSEIVAFIATEAIKYINNIKTNLKPNNALVNANNIKRFAHKDADGLSKCVHLLGWLPSANLTADSFVKLMVNSNIVEESASSLSLHEIAKRAPADGVSHFLTDYSDAADSCWTTPMFYLAKDYVEWSHEQIAVLLSVQTKNDNEKRTFHHILKYLLGNDAVNGDEQKTALISHFLYVNGVAVAPIAGNPPTLKLKLSPQNIKEIEKACGMTLKPESIEAIEKSLDETFKATLTSDRSPEQNKDLPLSQINKSLSFYIVPQNVSIPLSKDNDSLKYYAEIISGKPVPLVAAPNPEQVFGELQRHFPWAERLNNIVCRQIAMNRTGRGYAFVRPLLIHGKPGVGKTRYAQFLAEHMGVPFTLFSAAGNADSMLLKGSARGWSSTRPSFAIETIVKNKVANPLILVDEIDKANRSPSNGSIEQYLHGVMDPGSAEKLLDECLMVPVNLSAVSWILTANHIENFSSSFLERLISVEIPRPSSQHHETLTRSMLASLMKEYQMHESMMPGIPEGLWNTFIHAADNPRMLRKMMETWLGEAARHVSMQ